MSLDPLVDEIHEIRQKLLDECGSDLRRLMEGLKKAETEDAARLISREQLREIRRGASSPSQSLHAGKRAVPS